MILSMDAEGEVDDGFAISAKIVAERAREDKMTPIFVKIIPVFLVVLEFMAVQRRKEPPF